MPVEVENILNAGVWNYVGVTYAASTSTLRIYKNGKLAYKASSSVDWATITNADYLYVEHETYVTETINFQIEVILSPQTWMFGYV